MVAQFLLASTPDINSESKACFISYNSRGFGPLKTNLIRQLASREVVGNKIPIISIQESFILRENSYKIFKALPGFQILINPAVKNNLGLGRPKNGMFIAFPNSIKKSVEDVSPGHWRIQAVKIKFQHSTMLLINSYFPTDTVRPDGDENELLMLLGKIREVIRNNEFDSLIWAGDINADFLRNSNHTRAVSDTLDDLELTRSWSRFEVDFTHSHELLGDLHTAVLDHFFWSEAVDHAVTEAGVLHLPDNKSDHCPIFCVVDLGNLQQEHVSPAKQKPRPSWKRATGGQREEYRNLLDEKLADIVLPKSVTECRDLGCRDPNHMEELDSLILSMLDTVQDVSEITLPTPQADKTQKSSRKIPGWKEEVKPFRDQAYFWHQLWLSCGRPLNTEVHRIMRMTRNRYHYEFKKCKKSEEKIRRNKLLNACINEGADIFNEIKAMRKSNTLVASSMDGSDDVGEVFKDKYKKLYNSANDGDKLNEVAGEVTAGLGQCDLDDVDKVTPEIVKEAARRLKPGKSDSVYSFTSDCLRNAKDSLYEKLAVVLKGFLIHGHVTLVLLLATLVPIIKDKLGSISASKNYRSIALSSMILKLLDWIFLLLFGSKFNLNDFQYAYQAGFSTTMCTWAAVETVEYFLKYNSEVFSCAMDMTAAFDLTLHSILFRKMLRAGFPPVFLRLFIFIYMNQAANVRWNGEVSSLFPMTNGCRQGAVLSAIAYCFYCEDLFALLKKRRTGCWVLGYYHGILGYSDDNWLLAPSLAALQDMLRTCEEYARSHNLKFSTDPNPSKCKTKLMAFTKRPRELPNLELCGVGLPWVDKIKHLGNTISNKVDGNQLDIKVKTAKYVDRSNSLFQEFSFAHPYTRNKVNSIFNYDFTGSQLWSLNCREMEKLESTYNKSVKVMFDMPWATHRYYIEPMTEQPHLRKVLIKRYLSFLAKIKTSEKKPLKNLLELSMKDLRTTTGKNMRWIMLMTGKSTVDDLGPADADILEYHEVPEEESWRIDFAKEIVNIKYGELEANSILKDELDHIMNFICCS